MLLLLLLLASTGNCQVQHVSGYKKNGSCACEVNTTAWLFPAKTYEATLQHIETCEDSLKRLQEQVHLSKQRLPDIYAVVDNITRRLEPFQYLHYRGVYSALALRQLGEELSKLETNIDSLSFQGNNDETTKLSKEVQKLKSDVERMQRANTGNMKSVRERLRYLKNSVESCLSIPRDFKGQQMYCLKGLITNVSAPVTTKISPFGKNYISGSWGQQAMMDSDGLEYRFWIQPLLHGHTSGNSLRVYQSYADFMASANHKDFIIVPSHVHANSVEGPSAVLYGKGLYYHCYGSADVCRYDLDNKAVARVTLPGIGKEYRKFPYCYFECRANSDVDVEVDETGLWAIYATVGSHGNIVVSRLSWDDETETLNVTRTWETRLFKKATTNAFMVCGVLYATRFLDDYNEEVFYAFDTETGREDNTLTVRLQKIGKGVASLGYNPVNRQLYMYNDGYLLAYKTHF
ncbi:olfactomedin-like [Corythoichthys intestinalis]|uniref:olfactomedin-like n=1 Tax=Corythoichthys intestinalis TaxID=161448 RepID=UPI0025A59FE3|nr:olfactomedin-like [Corythoichthys intestinalis]XP_061812356.1 olfactomedin-like [Nerophis lumbriciformis]